MNTTASECYESKGGCRHMVYPTSVKPPRRRREKRTESNHSCDAPDCLSHKDSGIAEGGASHFSRTGVSKLPVVASQFKMRARLDTSYAHISALTFPLCFKAFKLAKLYARE